MNQFGSIVNTTLVHYDSRMTSNDAQMKIRLPEGVRETIAMLAKKNNRSMNAEIIARLERTLDEDAGNAITSTPEFMIPFMARIEQLIAEHGIEYIFPEEDHQGRKRRIKPKEKK